MSEPTEDLLKIIKDTSESDDERSKAAYMYGLLMFAERINDETVRITNNTQEKLQMYISFLRQIQEMQKWKKLKGVKE